METHPLLNLGRTVSVPDVCPPLLLGPDLDFSYVSGEWLACYEDQVSDRQPCDPSTFAMCTARYWMMSQLATNGRARRKEDTHYQTFLRKSDARRCRIGLVVGFLVPLTVECIHIFYAHMIRAFRTYRTRFRCLVLFKTYIAGLGRQLAQQCRRRSI